MRGAGHSVSSGIGVFVGALVGEIVGGIGVVVGWAGMSVVGGTVAVDGAAESTAGRQPMHSSVIHKVLTITRNSVDRFMFPPSNEVDNCRSGKNGSSDSKIVSGSMNRHVVSCSCEHYNIPVNTFIPYSCPSMVTAWASAD
jgi:formylmethanofuran dehydrogenase subunit C